MIKENQVSIIPSEKDSFELKTLIIKDALLVNTVLEDFKQWKSCNHPNISHLESFKFDQIEGSYPSVNYTIEKAPLSLLDIIEERADIRNHFTPEEYVIYCLQLLSGLSYLHKKNIPHKSLRLSNVLITSTGELKLTNLVNLNIYEEISTSSLNISPELQGIKGKIGTNEFFKMDIWRLGMLFIELAKLSKLEEFVKSDNKFEGFPESYGKKIPKIILQMIESDPNRRYSLKKVFDDFKKISKQLNIK